MGLFDGLLGGGAGSADDPYADILTPAQRNQMQVQGLLAMAGAFAQAGMPSRLPVPFGSALGSAAAALGTGQEAGMKTAIENALAAQKVRDLRNMAEYRKKVLGDIDPTSPLGRAIDAINNPGGTTPTPGPTTAGATPSPGTYARPGASPAAPAAGGPLTMELPYAPGGGGGLLGSDVGAEGEYGAGQKNPGGLLGPAPPPDQRAALPSADLPDNLNQLTQKQQNDAVMAATGRPLFPPGTKFNSAGFAISPDLSRALPGQRSGPNIPADVIRGFAQANALGAGSGSSTAPAEPDPGAGGDTPWGPTFAQGGASGGPTRGDPRGKIPVIQAAAMRYGVDPDVAVKVAGSEGLGTFYGDGGKSGTAFQLYTGGGLGNVFQKETGLDPLDPKNEDAAIDWAMRNVSKTGWEPYHGAKLVGVGNRTGLLGGTTEGSGGGQPEPDAGWGPTFAQGAAEPRMPATTGGPDRVIPSGAGGNPPAATLAQYAPGAGGAPMPGAAPGAAPVPGATGGPPLYPSAAPAGGQAAGVSQLIVELARRNAAAEVLGLGNPYGSLLTVLQGSPQYGAAVEAAKEEARRRVGLGYKKEESRLEAEGKLPSEMARDVNKGVVDQLNKQIEQMGAAALNPAGTILVNGPNGPVERQVTQLQSAQARAGFDVPEIGFKGMRGPLPAGQIPGLPGVALPGAAGTPGAGGGTPGPQSQYVAPGGPGTLYDKPYLNPGQIKAQETAATDAQALAQSYRTTADLAVGAKATLQNISGEIGSMVNGPFAPAAQAAASYLRILDPGFNKQVQSYEELYANANELVRKAVRQSDPNPSFIQTQMAFNSMPVPEKSPAGLQQITNRMIGVNDHDIARAAAIDQYKAATGSVDGFDSYWRKNVSPYAFVFSKMVPDDQRALVTKLNSTDQGKREIAKLKDQLGFIKQNGLEQ